MARPVRQRGQKAPARRRRSAVVNVARAKRRQGDDDRHGERRRHADGGLNAIARDYEAANGRSDHAAEVEVHRRNRDRLRHFFFRHQQRGQRHARGVMGAGGDADQKCDGRQTPDRQRVRDQQRGQHEVVEAPHLREAERVAEQLRGLLERLQPHHRARQVHTVRQHAEDRRSDHRRPEQQETDHAGPADRSRHVPGQPAQADALNPDAVERQEIAENVESEIPAGERA